MKNPEITNEFTDLQKAWFKALETSVKHKLSLIGPDKTSMCCLGVACFCLPDMSIIEIPDNVDAYGVKGGDSDTIYSVNMSPTSYVKFSLLNPYGKLSPSKEIFVSPNLTDESTIYKSMDDLSDLNDKTNLTHIEISQILQEYPGLFFSNFDVPKFDRLTIDKCQKTGNLIFEEEY